MKVINQTAPERNKNYTKISKRQEISQSKTGDLLRLFADVYFMLERPVLGPQETITPGKVALIRAERRESFRATLFG